jgi:glycosyltransferase involved in cell wall biosynthesis
MYTHRRRPESHVSWQSDAYTHHFLTPGATVAIGGVCSPRKPEVVGRVRILIITHYFPPEVGAPQSRLSDLASSLARRGHEVTVLTGFPNYPDGVIQSQYRGRWFQVERIECVEVIRTAVYPAPNRGVVRRLLNHASFALSCVVSSPRTGAADVVVVETPPLFTAAAGVVVARLKQAGMVLHVADLWPDAVIALGALESRVAIAGARAIERFAYRHADRIAVPSPGFRRVLLDRGQPPEQVVLVPHGVDPARFPRDGGPEPVPGRVVYSGTIGMSQGTGTLLDAAEILERAGHRYEFVLAGDGAERADLAARASDMSSVTFAGWLPRDQLPSLLATAQVTVATQRNLPFWTDALSTKVLEYMAAARPVVGAVSGWTAEVIGRAKAGIVCPPEQPQELARAIAELASDPVRAREMGLSGRCYVERHLTRERAVDRLEQALESVGRGTGPGG